MRLQQKVFRKIAKVPALVIYMDCSISASFLNVALHSPGLPRLWLAASQFFVSLQLDL